MLSFFLIILCLNIDALSYGIAYGIKRTKFKILFVINMSLLSTVLFAVPLYVSKYIYEYFNETLLQIINGIILIILGIKYIFSKSKNQNIKKNKEKIIKKLEKLNYSQNTTNKICKNKNKIKNKYKNIKFWKPKQKKNTICFKNNFKQCFLECTAFSVDAMFTALLSGFSANYYVFSVIFYGITNFLAIFCGNLIFYKINKNLKFNLNIFSGLIFIFLGMLKMMGI